MGEIKGKIDAKEQNIYALEGFKVKVTGFTGYCDALAKEHLKIGSIYTVDRTVVHSWSTDYYFKEIPDIAFSSFECEDISVQSEEDNKKHPDWNKYN